MWWSFRRSKRLGKRSQVTLTKAGLGVSTGTRRVRVSASRRGGRVSFGFLGLRFGSKLW